MADDEGHAQHLEVNGRPVFVKAVNYIPWQHFAEVGRSFYDRDMRLITEAHGNSIGVHAHVQSPHAYDAADDAGVLTFQDFPLQWFYDSGTETNPGFIEEAQHQIAEMAYLLHAHPSVVYYACHNEPLRMFVPTSAEDDTPERDVGERHLDAALFATLASIDDSRHVHEASGIGDDAHSYPGSLSGRNLYRVSEQPAWFVSEYGFWTVGPQAAKYGDAGWPPTPEQMREWVSRLSFIGSTVGFAGLPDRYPSLAEWSDATEEYGAALAKHQTEWFRIHRGAPFMGYRWHFWADWWGYAGGGLVDIERAPKRTYSAFRDASRPILVTARTDRSVYEPGEVRLPVFIGERHARAVAGAGGVGGLRRDLGRHHARPGRVPHRPGVPRRRRRGRGATRERRGHRSRRAHRRRTGRAVDPRRRDHRHARARRRAHRQVPLGRRDQLRAPALPGRRRGVPARTARRRMTRTLGNGAVELELGTGEWTARWESCGLVLGPCRATVERDDARRRAPASGPRRGAWRVDTTRTGARARWTDADGRAWVELILPADGEILEVQSGFRPEQATAVRSLVPLAGRVSPGLETQLVNGYDSWSYSGLRAETEATDSYWSSTLATGAGALAFQALSSEHSVTRITRTGDDVTVHSEGSPTHHLVDGSWGHENRASTSTRPVAAGEEIVSEPIAIAAGPDPLAITEAVAALLPRRPWHGPPALGWESWYYYATRISIGPAARERAAAARALR